jgi:hypothetical protein
LKHSDVPFIVNVRYVVLIIISRAGMSSVIELGHSRINNRSPRIIIRGSFHVLFNPISVRISLVIACSPESSSERRPGSSSAGIHNVSNRSVNGGHIRCRFDLSAFVRR